MPAIAVSRGIKKDTIVLKNANRHHAQNRYRPVEVSRDRVNSIVEESRLGCEKLTKDSKLEYYELSNSKLVARATEVRRLGFKEESRLPFNPSFALCLR